MIDTILKINGIIVVVIILFLFADAAFFKFRNKWLLKFKGIIFDFGKYLIYTLVILAAIKNIWQL